MGGNVYIMAWDRPTRQEIIDRIAGDFKNSISGAVTLALRAVLQIMARVYGATVHLLYGYLDNMTLQRFVKSSTGIYLEALANEYGLLRKAATAAAGTAACTGTPATLIPAGSELQSVANNVYTTDADATIGIGGSVDVDVTASEVGSAGNDNDGTILTFVTPIVDVDTTATVDSDGLTGGTDEEEDDDLRERLFLRKQLAPHSGNDNDLKSWALEVSGVTRVWVIESYNGPGTVAVFFVRDQDVDIFPNEAAIAEVRAYLISHVDSRGITVGVPTTMKNGLFVLSPIAKTINFSIALEPNTSDVQTAVEDELEDLLYRDGGPGQTVYLSQQHEAVSNATGETRHRILVPVDDVAANTNELHVMGTTTWSDYS